MTRKKTIYSYLDGNQLRHVPVEVKNERPNKKADLFHPEEGVMLVGSAPFSETSADGCWSFLPEPPPPDPAVPDERDEALAAAAQRIAKLEGQLSSAREQHSAAESRAGKAEKRVDELTGIVTARDNRIAELEKAATAAAKEKSK